MTARAYALLLSFALSLSGCASPLFDDSCGPERRSTVARGDPRSGQVTKARLLAKADVVREFAFLAGNEHEIIRIPPEAMLQVPFDALKQRAIAGELVLELETTLVGNTRLLAPLPLQLAGDWSRASCS